MIFVCLFSTRLNECIFLLHIPQSIYCVEHHMCSIYREL